MQLALFFSLGRSSICPYNIDYTHCANLVQGIALSKTALGSPVIMLHAYASKGCPLHAQLSSWRFLLMAAVRTLLLQILGSRVLTCRPHEGSGTSYSNLKPYALKIHSVTDCNMRTPANIGAKPLSPHFAKNAQLAHMCSSKPADQTIASQLQRSHLQSRTNTSVQIKL